MLLRGKKALVTGGGRGIGRAVAEALSAQGAEVALTARSRDELEQTAARIRANGATAHCLPADLADPAGVSGLAEAAEDTLGQVDLLVNNAGYARFRPFHEMTLEEWQRTLDVNLTAPFLLTQQVTRAMAARGEGRVINISSVAGLKPIAHQSAYVASKHGLNGLSKVMALELRERGVHVHWVCPGGVRTQLADEAMPERDKSNWMLPEEIARVCVFLAGLGPHGTVDEVVIRRFGSVPLGG
jgi:NAD(P)-dependent dehydrogenase (short-subunit alcohol dehydrogenase family)